METSGGIQASLGGRYAIALFELARDAKTIDTVESSLAGIRDALAQSDDLRALTASPLVARSAAVKAVLGVADSLGIDATTGASSCRGPPPRPAARDHARLPASSPPAIAARRPPR